MWISRAANKLTYFAAQQRLEKDGRDSGELSEPERHSGDQKAPSRERETTILISFGLFQLEKMGSC